MRTPVCIIKFSTTPDRLDLVRISAIYVIITISIAVRPLFLAVMFRYNNISFGCPPIVTPHHHNSYAFLHLVGVFWGGHFSNTFLLRFLLIQTIDRNVFAISVFCYFWFCVNSVKNTARLTTDHIVISNNIQRFRDRECCLIRRLAFPKRRFVFKKIFFF